MQPWFFNDRPSRADTSHRRVPMFTEVERKVLVSGLRHRAQPNWRAS